jgi:hypothetical protein
MVVPSAPAPDWRSSLRIMPPWVRIAAGGVFTLVGGGMLMMGSMKGVFGLAGVPLVWKAWQDVQQRCLDAQELSRARAELAGLRAAVKEAVRVRHDVDRLLRELGYRSAKVRRWIALECDVVLVNERG